MRVAALYDIHGNLFALDAVLAAVREARVDLVVIGGDVLPGPMPREALARLMALDLSVQFIHGNGDRIVATHLAGGDISEVPEAFRSGIDWTAQQLEPGQRETIAQWPSTLSVDIDGIGPTLFCHATPRNDVEIFTRATSDERVQPAFAGVAERTVVCGHTHMPFDRTVGRHRIVNAGSVGMPFAAPRGAYWALLGPEVEIRRTDYDVEHAAATIRATGYPQAEMALRYILDPPAEEDSLRMFAGAEIT